MKSEVRPICWTQLHPPRLQGRRSHAYESPTAITSTPRRSRKNDGEEVQKSDLLYALGRNDAAYAAIASTAPPTPSDVFARISARSALDPWRSSSAPTNAPANTKPAHGKIGNPL